MSYERLERLAAILTEAGKLHHRYYRITGGEDADWATWYADWLVNLSELSEILGKKPARSAVTHLLVDLEKEHAAGGGDEAWETFYARAFLERLG